jgi:hypothetical protein
MQTEANQFPLLTLEKLAVLERKVEMNVATLKDLKLIEHYLESINETGLKDDLNKVGLLSLEEYLLLLKNRWRDNSLKVATIGGCLLGYIDLLQLRVKRGEKIY